MKAVKMAAGVVLVDTLEPRNFWPGSSEHVDHSGSSHSASVVRSRGVASNANDDRNSRLCFTAGQRTGVLCSSEETLGHFTQELSPQRYRNRAVANITNEHRNSSFCFTAIEAALEK